MQTKIFIKRGEDGFLYRSDNSLDWSRTNLSESTVYDGETLSTLEDLIDQWALISDLDQIDSELNLQAQYNIGRMLCRELGSPDALRGTQWLHLVPVLAPPGDLTPDNEKFLDLFCRIPWNILTRTDDDPNPRFLMRDPVRPASVTIDAFPGPGGAPLYEDVRVPSYPRILLVIPVLDAQEEPTHGREHAAKVNALLESSYREAGKGDRIAHATTFDEFSRALSTELPHILYFYGHAKAVDDTTEFLFDPSPAGESGWINIDQIRILISESMHMAGTTYPAIWINACKGASAKRNSFLRRFSPLASTVLTTRTLAAVEDSRAIAEIALPLIALQGKAPHSALRAAIEEKRPPISSGRWATTVVSVQYKYWSALDTETRQADDQESAGDFPSRLDRVAALSKIENTMTEYLGSAAGEINCFGWKGDREQRMDIFGQRVCDLLEERLQRWPTVVRKVDLALNANPNSDLVGEFLTSLLAAGLKERPLQNFLAPTTAEVRKVIERTLTPSTMAFLFVHGPFTSLHGALIAKYVKFWEEYKEDLRPRRKNVHIILAFAFDREPTHFSEQIAIADGFIELGPVPAAELGNHLKAFHILYRLPERQAANRAQELVEELKGSFGQIYARLEQVANTGKWESLA